MKTKTDLGTVGYRPDDEVRKFIAEYCPEKGGLAKSQLIDVAMKFLMMNTKEAIKDIIHGVMTGQWDRESFEVAPGGKTPETKDRQKAAG